ncbi:MAG: MltA domain-containing protein, partial [Pseudomonadota bacterium]
MRRNPFLALVVLGLAACGAPDAPGPGSAPPARLTPIAFADLPDWSNDRHGGALTAFLETCRRWRNGDPTRSASTALLPDATRGDLAAPCAAARTASADGGDAAARRFFEAHFQPFAVTADETDEGLFTGYYEPTLPASPVRTARFSHPLYAKPADLIELDLGLFRADLRGERIVGRVEAGGFVPYHDRGAIMDGALTGQALEVAWLDDPVEAFFLQIQGSGKLIYPDGQAVRVGYAGKNGRPYASIGRALVEKGEMTLDQASAQSIKRWVRDNPDRARDLLATNESFVFFATREDDGRGPIGAQGAPLTAGRSMAIDRSFLPLGLPFWLDLPYVGAPAD